MDVRSITLQVGADQDGFRNAVRALIGNGVPPEQVIWQTAMTPSLFDAQPDAGAPPLSLPRDVAELVRTVVCHRADDRYAALYSLVWRILRGERHLLDVHSDPMVFKLAMMAKEVRRDIHKMHAFVRFRRLPGAEEAYAAWFEPEHHIVEAVAGFFADRFPGFAWSIFTPRASLHWDKADVSFGPPGRREDVPDTDAFEAGWGDYYASTFNPARLNSALMRQHMPKKYWRNMPEAKLIPDLVRSAGSRVEQIMSKPAMASRKRSPDKAVAARHTSEPRTLAELYAIIAGSEPFVQGGKRAVLGEGPLHPAIAFVGEQPGDQEDLEGRPFVGPAGQLLDRAMHEAGVDRGKCFVTNAVKHFKFLERGKRRLHQKPTTGEVKHYRWWLEREMEIVDPKLIVALGGTAVLALTGKSLPITRVRGPYDFDGHPGYITVHPSYLLRIPDAEARREAYEAFVSDLRQAEKLSHALRAA